ncbi:histidine phosphatase family protein, partial [Treponema sp. OttesenSCG-928-L16]|nr:histidine phosphatase family protein [Treponema sp. OttesenSCG-928-L16]
MDTSFFSSLNGKTSFYFIRHGQSEGNSAAIFQGRGEYPLSEMGRTQAVLRGQSLGMELSDTDKRKILIYSSPLLRAKETAEIISREAALPGPVFLEDLQEMHLGAWTGKNWNQVQEEEPVLWERFRTLSWETIENAETSGELFCRAMRVWTFLRDEAERTGASAVVS